jgi:hypothetical protein
VAFGASGGCGTSRPESNPSVAFCLVPNERFWLEPSLPAAIDSEMVQSDGSVVVGVDVTGVDVGIGDGVGPTVGLEVDVAGEYVGVNDGVGPAALGVDVAVEDVGAGDSKGPAVALGMGVAADVGWGVSDGDNGLELGSGDLVGPGLGVAVPAGETVGETWAGFWAQPTAMITASVIKNGTNDALKILLTPIASAVAI